MGLQTNFRKSNMDLPLLSSKALVHYYLDPTIFFYPGGTPAIEESPWNLILTLILGSVGIQC